MLWRFTALFKKKGTCKYDDLLRKLNMGLETAQQYEAYLSPPVLQVRGWERLPDIFLSTGSVRCCRVSSPPPNLHQAASFVACQSKGQSSVRIRWLMRGGAALGNTQVMSTRMCTCKTIMFACITITGKSSIISKNVNKSVDSCDGSGIKTRQPFVHIQLVSSEMGFFSI